MRKSKVLVPEPNSKFFRIKCGNCGNEQTVFSHSTFPVRCTSCGQQLTSSTGGKAKVLGEVTRVLA
ncbi:30S ribosomal protein S27e [Sulfodiicoccus acidiphilus]|uniref:30S ribosomal protein S27e n=1 Tax=Sulfodiicoccus acidiphilus TaxID=1670455 RepID=UPI000F83A1B1